MSYVIKSDGENTGGPVYFYLGSWWPKQRLKARLVVHGLCMYRVGQKSKLLYCDRYFKSPNVKYSIIL